MQLGGSMQTITNDDLGHRLEFNNPWWDSSFQIETNSPQLPKRAFYPAFFSQLKALENGRMLVLAGLDYIGKTTMVRHVMADLLHKGVRGQEILYFDLAAPSYAFASPARLVDAVAARFGHDRDNRLYLFFDETQYLDGWREKLQTLASEWPKARVVAVVSNEATPASDMETFVLPPLTFSEYLNSTKSGESLFGEDMTLSPGAMPALNDAFWEYVNLGGFPKDAAMRVLHRDLAARSGIGDPRDLDKLFAVLARNTASEITIEELVSAVGVAKNTLRKYLDFLEQAFLIRRLSRLDRDGKRFQRAVAFKVYLTTPSLYTALFGPVSPDDAMFPRLAETALVAQWMGSDNGRYLAYASWRGGGIDLLEVNPDTDVPDHVYEIDWHDGYASPDPKADKGPKELTAFVVRTNPVASTHILTGSTARRGAMAGIDITLAPLALYAYGIGRASKENVPDQ